MSAVLPPPPTDEEERRQALGCTFLLGVLLLALVTGFFLVKAALR